MVKTCVICDAMATVGSRTCNSTNCSQEYRQWLQQGKALCVVCGCRLNNTLNKSCGATRCVVESIRFQEMTARGHAGNCVQCGVFTTQRASQATGEDNWHCHDLGCNLRLAIERRRQEQLAAEAKRRDYYQQAEALKCELANGDQELQRTFAVAVVPCLEDANAQLAEQSTLVDEFKQHLHKMVQAAFTQPEAASDIPVQIDTLPTLMTERERPAFNAGCGACYGKCCTQGAGHAFISISTIRRTIRQQMALSARESPSHGETPSAENTAEEAPTAEDIEQLYLSFLPERSVVASCSYHTDRGCVLPGELRADMCNHYLCRTLLEMREQLQDGLVTGFFIVAGSQDGVRRPRFLSLSSGDASTQLRKSEDV